jgi:hypothetical protein
MYSLREYRLEYRWSIARGKAWTGGWTSRLLGVGLEMMDGLAEGESLREEL